MERERFKRSLINKNYGSKINYKEQGKWLIIESDRDLGFDNMLPDYVCFNNIGNVSLNKKLPENIIFNNHGNIFLNITSLRKMPENIIFGKNVKYIYRVKYNTG